MNTEKGFWEKAVQDRDTGCLIWSGGLNRDGYGRFRFNGIRYLSHRLAWILIKGEISEGLLVCHKCNNPPCINPLHLKLGTDADNQAYSYECGRSVDPPKHEGETHPSAKLTEQGVVLLRRMMEEGCSNVEISRLVGVNHQTVSKIRHRKLWKNV